MIEHDRPRLLRSKLFWVAILYFSEGFPLGLFFDLFPVYFRQQGVDLGSIGLLSLLGLAWTVKFLWAPAIDHYRHHRYWMVAVDCLMGATLMVLSQMAGFGPGVWLAIGAHRGARSRPPAARCGRGARRTAHRRAGQWSGAR